MQTHSISTDRLCVTADPESKRHLDAHFGEQEFREAKLQRTDEIGSPTYLLNDSAMSDDMAGKEILAVDGGLRKEFAQQTPPLLTLGE